MVRSIPRLRLQRWTRAGTERYRDGTAARLARYLAPAVFLLVVTGVVLLVRAALRPQTSTHATVTVSTQAHVTSRPATRPTAPKRYYVIASGDTLGAIAGRFGTTVDRLLRLNPGVRPTALRPGEQIRIR